MTTETTDRAREKAQAQLEGIIAMVKRLEHCNECDGGEDCELTDEQILEGLELASGQEVTDEEREQYHDEDEARERIQEDPLSVQVRSGWHTPCEASEPMEYEILLCTGGPAVRIIGQLGRYNEPESAELQCQDWSTPWEELITTGEDNEALLTYARSFYFGE